MKIFEFNKLLLLLAFIQFTGYAQSEKNMTNNSITIPLKNGVNPVVQFKTLVIEPTNLVIQPKPQNKIAPYIQLELNVIKNNTKYSTFFRCIDAYSDNQQTNYPKAYQDYCFDLKINKEEVALVVEKLDFGKTMFLDLRQTAVIGNLTVLFEDCITEQLEDEDGSYLDAFNTYNILLSEENEQERVFFLTLNKYPEKELLIEWKNYKIVILEDSEKALKLRVFKNDSKKKTVVVGYKKNDK